MPVFQVYEPHSDLSISSLSATTFVHGVAVNETIICSWDGDLPYLWVKVSGTLPTGWTLNGGSIYTPYVTITGTPTVAGTYTFKIRGTDAYGEYAEKTYTVIIT